MKKLLSILLLALLLFNTLGLYGILVGLKYKNSLHITKRLNKEDYEERETVLLKIPISVPYMGNTEFERVSGEVEYNGEYYSLVKQKLSNDTLFVVCFKNTERKHIERALSDYAKTFADEMNSTGEQTKLVSSFMKDFLPTHIRVESLYIGWSSPVIYAQVESGLTSLPISGNYPPPRA